jgi:hypothetical protein
MARIRPSGLEAWMLLAMEKPTNTIKLRMRKRLTNVWESISVVLGEEMRLGRNRMQLQFFSITDHKKTCSFVVQVLIKGLIYLKVV